MKVDWLEIINIIMIFQLLIFSIFLFLRKTNITSNTIFGIHLLSQAAGIFHTLTFLQAEFFYKEYPDLAFTGYPLVFLWGPTFYLYVKSVAYNDFRIKWIHLVHFIPALIIFLFFYFTLYFLSTEAKRIILQDQSYLYFSYKQLFDIVLRIQILLYLIYSYQVLFAVKRSIKENFSSTLKTNLAWLRFIVIGYSICFMISITFIYTEFYLVKFNRLLFLGNFLQFFIYFNIIFFKAWSKPEIFQGMNEGKKYQNSKLKNDEAEFWADKLNKFVSEKKPFLKPDLTLNQLAEGIDINPKILSQIINEKFNRNFYDYVNNLRIEESKKMLLDPSNKKNVLEILYETGFNSKATFNRAFKKQTGLSPTEFRRENERVVLSQKYHLPD